MFRRALAALVCLLALTAPGFAQEQTGSIAGTVKDSTGAVLPGVAVELVNETRGSVTATVTTDELGNYRFVGLQPGKYAVSAKLQGFSQSKTENIDLRLGQLLTINPVLGVGAQAETIQVTGDSPIIDVRQSGKAFSVSSEQIERLPRGRDFTSVVTQAPGANTENRQGGGITIDGAAAAENRYIVDGVETTDPENGLQGKRLINDFVGEIQVKSSGYMAEYGGAVGGVVNVVTKSGTNQFRGDVGLYFTNDFTQTSNTYFTGAGTASTDPRQALRLKPTDVTQDEYIEYPADDYTQWDPGFSLGGPIFRDKLWFFGGYQPTMATQERTANLSDNTPVTKDNDFTRHYLTANVSGQPSNNTRFKLAFNQSSSQSKGVLPSQSLANEAGASSPSTVFDTSTNNPNWALSGNFDYVVTSNFFLGVRGGYYFQDEYTEGIPEAANFIYRTSNIGMAGVPPQFQNINLASTYNTNFATVENAYKRTNVQVDATYYANLGGQHTFKVGMQLDRLGNTVNEGQTGNNVFLYWNRAFQGMRGPYGYYRVRSNGADPKRGFITTGDVNVNNLGFFFQDSWTVSNRLTLNLGLRMENEKVPNYSREGGLEEYAIDWGFGDKLAPRLGFAWDLAGDGKTKIYGNWGVFYDTFKLELPRGSFGGDKWLEYWYTLDTYDYNTLITSPNCPPACSGELILGPLDFRHPSTDPEFNTVDPDLEPYTLQEASVGMERELNPRMSVGVRYVHKQVDRGIEDVGVLDEQQNEIYYIANPGYRIAEASYSPDLILAPVPKAVRDYDGVEFIFNKRLANNWALTASYLWSKLEGNYSGLTQSDEASGYGFRSSPNVGRNFDNVLMTYGQDGQPVYGPLGTDRPHQFKLQGIYDFNFGTTVGANYRIASGVPVTREAAAVEGNNFPIQYLGRASDGRLDQLSQTDLFLQHEFKVGGGRAIIVNLNVANLFNQDTEINRFFTELAASSGAAVDFDDADFFAGRVDFQREIANLGPADEIRDPRFLKSDAFQGARELRFGVKFRF